MCVRWGVGQGPGWPSKAWVRGITSLAGVYVVNISEVYVFGSKGNVIDVRSTGRNL